MKVVLHENNSECKVFSNSYIYFIGLKTKYRDLWSVTRRSLYSVGKDAVKNVEGKNFTFGLIFIKVARNVNFL